ncbi:MAG: hypothetical protein ACOY71_14530 [Gemmatimonadota bacterium]
MGKKLSSRQQAQLLFLEGMVAKMARLYAGIEQMSAMQIDDVGIRGLARMLDELKVNAQSIGLTAVADVAGAMGVLIRRGGSQQTRARGLRELYATLKMNYDAAMKAATTPELGGDSPAGTAGGSAGS